MQTNKQEVDVTLTAGLLVDAPVSGWANTPVAAHGVHALSHWTHARGLHTLVHI